MKRALAVGASLAVILLLWIETGGRSRPPAAVPKSSSQMLPRAPSVAPPTLGAFQRRIKDLEVEIASVKKDIEAGDQFIAVQRKFANDMSEIYGQFKQNSMSLEEFESEKAKIYGKLQ